MGRTIEITEKKLLLVEGRDAERFFVRAYQSFGVSGIQVIDFGGIRDLRKFLRQLPLLPNFEMVETVVVARDAEENPTGAADSIRDALAHAGLSTPDKPFQLVEGKPRIAFMLFPGPEKNAAGETVLLPGTLEDLCLQTVDGDPIFECIARYVSCLEAIGESVKRLHKTRLHAYLAGKGDFAGLKIGEAADKGAWNWGHERLRFFKAIIKEM